MKIGKNALREVGWNQQVVWSIRTIILESDWRIFQTDWQCLSTYW
jgi:hypothetical protein